MATELLYSNGPGPGFETANRIVVEPPLLQPNQLWIGGVSISSTTAPGSDTACTNGTFYFASVWVPCRMKVTGLGYLVGSVGGTDKVIPYLWDAAGTLIIAGDLAGTTVAATTLIQSVAFTDIVHIEGPGTYIAGVIFNGTTAKFRAHTQAHKFVSGSVAGTFGTSQNIVVPTTFTADKGPVGFIY